MTRVVLSGATGTIGRALARSLSADGDQLVALTRDAARGREVLGSDVEVHEWSSPQTAAPPAAALAGSEAVVHLLGEPVSQRWSEDAKRAIRDSRVLATRMLVGAIRALDPSERPRTLISGSAIGYYGAHGDEELDEHAGPGSDFLAEVVSEWEQEALRAPGEVRVVLTRTGVVLSRSGGALGTMLPFFKLGIGGPVAGGRQYIPWIHLDDLVAAISFSIRNGELRGPVNLTAPNPVANAEFSQALGQALHRPAALPVPGFALRALYGEMAQIVLTGQRAIPLRLRESGFEFRHPEIGPALRDVLGRG